MNLARRYRGKGYKNRRLIDRMAEILEQIKPATGRAVCYQLFVRGLIPNMEKASTMRVYRQLADARERGLIPWSWIVDETRRLERPPSWENPEEILDAVQEQYRKDAWASQPVHVEVWSEKGTVRGTLSPVLKEFGVGFRVMHGFTSATVAWDLASLDGDKPKIALYTGDHDPSGLHMSEIDLPARLARYREGPDGSGWELVRLALTAEDVADPDLPPFPANRRDPRYQWYRARHGARAWEVDALSPPVLRDRVKTVIESYIDWPAWERSRQAEEAEKASIAAILDSWRASKLNLGSVCSRYGGLEPELPLYETEPEA